jgi:hypothetical protein
MKSFTHRIQMAQHHHVAWMAKIIMPIFSLPYYTMDDVLSCRFLPINLLMADITFLEFHLIHLLSKNYGATRRDQKPRLLSRL